MTEEQADRLFELADRIHALSRQLQVPADLKPGNCTSVEMNVIRFVSQNPGTSAGAAARASRLPSSNFSRVMKSLIAKGLLRREQDEHDARGLRLYPTELAAANFKRMRAAWSRALAGTIEDPETLHRINDALRHIEACLVARPEEKNDR